MDKIKKGRWDSENLKIAIEKVINKKMSLRESASRYGIPTTTLYDKLKLIREGKEVELKPVLGRFTKTFSSEYENVLVSHVKDLADRCMPLTKKEFLKLAFDLAVHLKIPHRFNVQKEAAGKHFYYEFMKRHPDLSLRTAESTSLMRAVGFNRAQVNLFFINLKILLDKYNFPPSNVYNCDETGVTTVQKHAKVMAKKNTRQIGKLTSAERGKNVTILFCMSATGNFIPPFFIFPRQRMHERLMINSPPDSEGVAQPKGWMNNEFFLKWLHHFTKFARPSKESPILLLLDGHSSHKTLEVINWCRDNNIHLISSPPHTTHKLQPLDRSFMKPFKNAYNEQCGMWIRANAGARITEYDIAGLVSDAFKKVARYEIAAAGFRCTGIYPFNENIFSDLDYLPSDITNIPIEESVEEQISVDRSSPVVQSTIPEQIHSDIILPQSFSPQPSTSKGPDCVRQAILNISPLPDAAKKRAQTRKRKSEKSQILTASPYKLSLENKENEKLLKEQKKLQRTFKKTDKADKIKKTKVLPLKEKEQQSNVSSQAHQETSCVVCLEDHDEDWIQCNSCKEWAHEACADIPECSELYICDRCHLF
ncbi:uncharacterized protein LOC111351487 isoform X1 [Spodoptera litura]|uniref:Uncharacterized protein LOC111351487 isoform X1 n=1 Tax=Spodoptera litura TaxID=69820 RepID=A0A9J7IMC5_SPOLT|nr:uncharacterized protein LOC111351487 isoform X1 [Spodoptera litura]